MRNTFHLSAAAASLVLAFGASGCNKQATGQVAAVVNGDEITLQEVNAAVPNGKLPEGADKDKIRNAILQRLVDQRLIAQQAKADGLDRDPDYLLKQRQASQELLIQLYAKRAADTLRVPDQATVSKFITDHPETFANRMILTVNQLAFVPPRDTTALAGLKDIHTLDGVAAYLQSKGIAVQRNTTKIDTAKVPPATMTQVMALPAGEPFIVPGPQGAVANVIVSKDPAPLTGDTAQPLAVQMIRAQALDKVLQQRLQDATAKAKITYQPGFAPAPKPTPTAAAPKS